jgi:hypothetical protein
MRSNIHVETRQIKGKTALGVCRGIPSSARERAIFVSLAKTAKQAMLVLSSMQPDAARRTTAAALIQTTAATAA